MAPDSRPDANGEWKALLEGSEPGLARGRHLFRLLPRDPRCKLCNAPFAGSGGVVARLVGRGPGTKNPRICSYCERFAEDHPGGAEVMMSMAFADVRDSTGLAAELGPRRFGAMIRRFFGIATEELGRADALIDTLVGDGVNAYFLPGFLGPDYADRAVAAMGNVVRRANAAEGDVPAAPVGAGVHTAVAFMGSVGSEAGLRDFTALGEPVNLAARLAGAAAAGELLLTRGTLDRLGSPVEVIEERTLELKGIADPVTVSVTRP